MSTSEYPRPTETPTNRPLLEAWREGRLSLPWCLDCGQSHYFPRPFCPHCWSLRLEWRDHAGTGKVLSYSRIHRHIHESFRADAPSTLAEIQLHAGPALLARVITNDSARVFSGSLVRLVSSSEAVRFPLPTFEPD